jgi:predicted  nucleic acid-binding Zn-ribbon protein
MKDLLDRKRKLMFDKEKEIKELGNQNSFLETVVDDYKKYNTAILEEKIKQKKALKILSDHIREIAKNIKNDEFKLNRVKMDQTALLEEIEHIRDEIAYVLKSSGSDKRYASSDDE